MSISEILRILILILEILLFTGFIWVIIAWFKKTEPIKRWELYFIKIGGLIFILAHLLAAVLYPMPAIVFSVAGISLLFISLILFLSTIKIYSDKHPAVAFSSTITATLKTSGPYLFIRHPFYTSYMLAWIGGTIATGCYWLAISPISMFIIYYRAAILEETQWLDGKDSDVYKKYKISTGMFLPKIF